MICIVFDKYKKVVDFCYGLFEIAELPLYNSIFSNRIYSNYSKLFLLVYKQFRKFTYEELLTDIASNNDLRTYLGLNKLPDYTTLIKFAKKLPLVILEKLMIAFKKLMPKPNKVAIDSTGISLDNASLHYAKRIGLPVKKRPFMKSSFIVDIEDYLILLYKNRKGNRHDTIDAKPMIKKLSKHYKPENFYADRAYDSEEIFELVIEDLEAYPFIYQKNQNVPKYKRHGKYRKQTYETFDYGEYLQRNKIETFNSIYKRKFNSSTKSRTDKTQKIEIGLRNIAYNIDRLIRMGKEIVLLITRTMRVSY